MPFAGATYATMQPMSFVQGSSVVCRQPSVGFADVRMPVTWGAGSMTLAVLSGILPDQPHNRYVVCQQVHDLMQQSNPTFALQHDSFLRKVRTAKRGCTHELKQRAGPQGCPAFTALRRHAAVSTSTWRVMCMDLERLHTVLMRVSGLHHPQQFGSTTMALPSDWGWHTGSGQPSFLYWDGFGRLWCIVKNLQHAHDNSTA